jgi:lipid II:glycine glycyltransferase (peptidoglycan interpeptide bridge formation enzyme)
VLRLQLILFSRDGREAMAATLREHGFREVRPPSVYQHTLAIDLRPSEEEIFASLGKSSRKRIRETMKMGLRAIVIDDPVYADRIRELQLEALRRTGGHTPSDDWRGILKMSKENPNLSRVLGLFHGEDTAPENMGAFGWVCNNGDHGEYRAAGSKSRGEVRIPFGYLLVWEMIRWAKESGVAWFDMGGVTLAGKNGTALEGISEFKRFFSQELIEVGAEWVFEPYPVRARIANVVSNGASQVRSWMGK